MPLRWAPHGTRILLGYSPQAMKGFVEATTKTLRPSQAMQVSKALTAVLTVKVARKALGIVTLSGRGEGLTAWRSLQAEYEPATGNMHAAMLSALFNPTWSAGEALFSDALAQWGNDIARYELQSSKPFGEDYRIAKLLVHSPEPFRGIMRAAPASVRGSHSQLRAYLREGQATGQAFSAAGVAQDAMEVGAVSGQHAPNADKGRKPWKGTKKGDGKTPGGKSSGGKGDSKNVGKGRSKVDKGGGKLKNKEKPPRFEGECNNCGKHGHKAATEMEFDEKR